MRKIPQKDRARSCQSEKRGSKPRHIFITHLIGSTPPPGPRACPPTTFILTYLICMAPCHSMSSVTRWGGVLIMWRWWVGSAGIDPPFSRHWKKISILDPPFSRCRRKISILDPLFIPPPLGARGIMFSAGLGSIPFFQFNSNSNSVIFNSNSNSNSRDSNSNSNSGDLKSRQAQLEKWPVDVSLEIDYNYTRYMYIKLL